MTLMFVAKIVGSATIGGFVGAKAGEALGKGIDKIRNNARVKEEKKEAEKMYYLTKDIKIESLV